MIRVPVPYEPNNFKPQFTARSRREASATDSINSRFVEVWQTDAPALQHSRRDVSGVAFWMDMNPTPSRLYREDIRQSQPFVVPGAGSNDELLKQTIALTEQITRQLDTITRIGYEIEKKPGDEALKRKFTDAQELYKLLLTRQKMLQIDKLSDNPYFNKYDIATDSRNLVREMTHVVTEDIVDRGVRESQRLLTRELENRWTPANYARDTGIDTLSAFELMRPKFNDMGRNYRF